MSDAPDLIVRLRDCTYNAHILGVCMEAADTIQALEAEITAVKTAQSIMGNYEAFRQIVADRDALRAALDATAEKLSLVMRAANYSEELIEAALKNYRRAALQVKS